MYSLVACKDVHATLGTCLKSWSIQWEMCCSSQFSQLVGSESFESGQAQIEPESSNRQAFAGILTVLGPQTASFLNGQSCGQLTIHAAE